MSNLIKWLVITCVWVVMMGALYGCGKESYHMERHGNKNKGYLNRDGERETWYVTKTTQDIIYSNLNLVKIAPKDSKYHAKMLIDAQDPNKAAYHIIAIGLLGQDLPEVRAALSNAISRFSGSPLPQRYDWPDLAERFKGSGAFFSTCGYTFSA